MDTCSWHAQKVTPLSAPAPPHRREELVYHRKIVRQFLIISITVSVVWFLATSSDFAMTTYWVVTGRMPPLALVIIQTLSTRSIGTVDAIILGGLCTTRSGRRRWISCI
jgi:hypothetical protein